MTRFAIVPLPAIERLPSISPPFEAAHAARILGSRARLGSESSLASLDLEEDSSPSALGPGDSHYELSLAIGDHNEDSHSELPGVTPLDSARNEPLPAADDEPPCLKVVVSNRWYSHFVDRAGPYYFLVAVGFGALSLAVLCFLLVSAINNGQTVSRSITALIVGCVGLVAFLLLSLTATALHLLLVDLLRIVRRLRSHSDQSNGIASE
jgi:hypothetical protein